MGTEATLIGRILRYERAQWIQRFRPRHRLVKNNNPRFVDKLTIFSQSSASRFIASASIQFRVTKSLQGKIAPTTAPFQCKQNGERLDNPHLAAEHIAG
jgi:hypothetical protein